jgi:prevent-host-death family protein
MSTHEKVSIGRVKRDVSDLVNRVAYGGERIILTSRGKPKAALVSIDDLERLRQSEGAGRTPLSQIDSLDDLVAAIRRLPPGHDTYEPARGSLAAALAAQPADPTFDLQAWNAGWARVEAEMKRIEAEDAARDEIS